MTTTARAARRRTRFLALLAVVLAAAAALAPAAHAASGDWRLGSDNTIDSPNPLKAYNTGAYMLFSVGYDLLVNFKTEDGTPDPDHSLATSWEISPDQKTVTFHLRQGVKWSDGQPFSSEDVKWTYDTVAKNKANVLRDYVANIASVDAPDPNTVVFHMSAPDARVLSLYVFILPKHVWQKYPIAKIHATDGPQPAVTTAPWVMQSWDVNGTTVLTQNPSWWGKDTLGTPAIKRILIINYKNKDGQLRDIKLGNLDGVLLGNGRWFNQLKGDKDVTPWSAPTAGFEEIAFNSCPPAGAGTCTGPGKDVKVQVVQDQAIRHALAWAIDRKALVQTVWAGQADPGNGIISQYFPTFYKSYEGDPDIGYAYDPAKAKQILADGGWDCSSNPCTKGGTKAEFTLLVRTTSDEQQNAAKRVRAWAAQIGIKIDLQVLTDDGINAKIYATGAKPDTYAPDYDAFLWDWGGDVGTPYFNFDVLRTGSSWTDSFFSNADYDRITKQALQTVDDQAKSADLLHQAERIALEQLPYVFLAHTRQIQLTRNDTWHGYVPSKDSPFGTNWLQMVTLKPGPEPAAAATTAASSQAGAATGPAASSQPGVTQEAAAATTKSSGGTSTGVIVGAAVVIAAAILGAALLLRNRGGGGGRAAKGGPSDWTEE